MRLSPIPARRHGVEWLDDTGVDPDVRSRSLRDVVRSNRLFGGRRAAVSALRAAVRGATAGAAGRPTVLDVGTGLADIPAALSAIEPVAVIGLDVAPSLLAEARPRLSHAIAGSALAIPLRDDAVDVTIASQVLHHFKTADAIDLLREMNRVTRCAVVVSDLRRSWMAAGGFWIASWLLRFHPVTRHDGVVSVLRGFTPSELASLIKEATGREPIVERRLGFRLVATWTP